MSDKIETGAKGEELAAEFFSRKGFEIVARNYRHNRGEIDLIVRREDWTIFVEVKTRSSSDFGQPEEFVTPAQANKIYDVAEDFIFSTDWKGNVRFDVVSVLLNGEECLELAHFEDAIN